MRECTSPDSGMGALAFGKNKHWWNLVVTKPGTYIRQLEIGCKRNNEN
jgi:hypothetical protein